MSKLNGRFRHFRVSIGSVLAAFLLVGCLQAAIMGIRDPISSGVGWFGNWLARKFHTDVILYREPPVWEGLIANLVVALLFFCAFVWVGRRTLRRSNPEAN